MKKKDKISEKTITRFPLYLELLKDLHKKGIETISSKLMARLALVKASQFRKDLSYFGEFGKPGSGYSVEHLIDRFVEILNLNCRHRAVLVGVGNLGMALYNFPGFKEWNFEIVKIFDSSPAKIGKKVGLIAIEDIKKLPIELKIPLGIITVPANAAQGVADLLVESKLKGILNFSGVKLSTPSSVMVRNIDLTYELAILNYYCCTD